MTLWRPFFKKKQHPTFSSLQSTKELLVGTISISKELLFCDSKKNEQWLAVREEKQDKPQPAVKLELMYDKSKSE